MEAQVADRAVEKGPQYQVAETFCKILTEANTKKLENSWAAVSSFNTFFWLVVVIESPWKANSGSRLIRG